MNFIDITLDLETLSLSVNAAILQMAVVAWNRYADVDPIATDFPPFVSNVDLRSCVADGFEIDPKVVIWWSRQTEKVKKEVLFGISHPLPQVLDAFRTWLDDLKKAYEVETVYLWAQGSDFDIAILRNVFSRYGVPFPINHRYFRDARTFIVEGGAMLFDIKDPNVLNQDKIYSKLSGEYRPSFHEALTDALRTSRQVWQVFKQTNERL